MLFMMRLRVERDASGQIRILMDESTCSVDALEWSKHALRRPRALQTRSRATTKTRLTCP
jgi:hypothetical protein